MGDPFHELNSAIRDQEKSFTKREMMAMHFVSNMLYRVDAIGAKPEDFPKIIDRICNESLMVADRLLEKVRTKRA